MDLSDSGYNSNERVPLQHEPQQDELQRHGGILEYRGVWYISYGRRSLASEQIEETGFMGFCGRIWETIRGWCCGGQDVDNE
ncbi:hypothetical protein GCK72_021296 [Caenorhabditis remanei]|uniref:Uncharacterized protein n=1 Tax=Caenorhabditis remanei TaxID=31234 RepID=A0A6A5GJQ8_CAERE|nr:hypothetical protein GCK72_021296 [Caenorhabditis remanei]KAF1754732.1 hypothetical protein GCK72_021296 [Caenorhabditis remanei]